jgi:hypothetical protein
MCMAPHPQLSYTASKSARQRGIAPWLLLAVISLVLALAVPARARAHSTCSSAGFDTFNVCTLNGVTGTGSEIPYTSSITRSTDMYTSGYTDQAGEDLGCFYPTYDSWAGKTGWVRFVASVDGTATVSALSNFNAVLGVYDSSLEPASFAELRSLSCRDEVGQNAAEVHTVHVSADRPLHIVVRGVCAYQTTNPSTPNPSTCTNYANSAFGNVSPLQVSFTCANRDGDAVCDTLDACPTEAGPLATGCPHRPPIASFNIRPNPARVNQGVTFDGSASTDPDGSVANYKWDLDGNGSFETSTGSNRIASRQYATARTIDVKLRVTDNHGNTNDTSRTLTVKARVINAGAKLTLFEVPNGIRVRALVIIKVPRHARVEVGCRHGRRHVCRRLVRKRGGSSDVGFRRLAGKRLRKGDFIEIRVTRSGYIGKYIRFTILKGDFRSTFRCMKPGSRTPRRKCG